MNSLVNYFLESNVALLLVLVAYYILLRQETHFGAVRILMLAMLAAAILFPLIHIQPSGAVSSIPSLRNVIPSYWLPQVVVGNANDAHGDQIATPIGVWNYLMIIYLIGIAVTAGVFLLRIFNLYRIVAKSKV